MQGPFMQKNKGKNAAPQDRDAQFVRACAVKMHMNIYVQIYKEKNGDQRVTPALTLTVRAPQSGHAVWGKKNWIPRPILLVGYEASLGWNKYNNNQPGNSSMTPYIATNPQHYFCWRNGLPSLSPPLTLYSVTVQALLMVFLIIVSPMWQTQR